ncbi:hypothetical protein [Streptomyces sp. TRM68416]|uniref:hypothetical protein n=1 Tax=Streptomyces sp. TRM68416 TaxID=2758412 RepID=UPI001CB74C6A|nr:hypothetical protein [Streptomyces sp. TRM68416]
MRAGRSGTAAALAGALALVAFTAPVAEASDTGITVKNLVINNGKPIIVGTKAEVTPDFTFNVSKPSGYSYSEIDAFPFLYHDVTAAQGAEKGGIYTGSVTFYDNGFADGELYIDPPYRLDSNKDATTWKIAVSARTWGSDGQPDAEEYLTGFGSIPVKRRATATVNASPEPVAKGATITVKGSAKRADWVKHTYVGFPGKLAKLQFRQAGTRTYKTVKYVRASSAGYLKTTVTASADGYWRWAFGETATTGGAKAKGDYVDVT